MSWLENVSRAISSAAGEKDNDAAPLVGSVLEAVGRGNPNGLTDLVQAFKAGGLGHITGGADHQARRDPTGRGG